MIESGITEGINKFYFLFKLSIYFWIISLVGGIILGIGPALLATMSVYQEVEWNYKEIKLAKLFELFKAYFIFGNQLLYTYSLIALFLFLSLYTSSQLTGLIFLIIDFMLIFLLLLVIVGLLFAFALVSAYSVSLKNVIKLSLILFFKELKASFSIIIFVALIVVVGVKMPALLFFTGAGSVAFFLSRLGKKIDENLIFE